MIAKTCLSTFVLLAIVLAADSQRNSRRPSSSRRRANVLPSKSVSGMGKTEDIEARRVTISGMTNQVTAGTCDDLSMSGMDNRVSASGTLSRISISGSTNQVKTGASGNSDISLSGSSNRVAHRGSNMAQLRVSGSSNDITTAARSASLSVSGSSNNVKTGKCQQLSLSGSSNIVTITGDCDAVTVMGSANELRVSGNVKTLRIGDPRNRGVKDCRSNGNGGSSTYNNVGTVVSDGDIIMGNMDFTGNGLGTSGSFNNYGDGSQDFSGANINSGGVIVGGNHGKRSRSRRGRGTVNKYNNYGGGRSRNINNSGTFIGNGMGSMFFNRAIWINSGNTVISNGNGPRRNTINVDGSIGKIEIIQGCETENGKNVITSGGSCLGGVSISGSQNKVSCTGDIAEIKFEGASARNVVSGSSNAGVAGQAKEISGSAPELVENEENIVASRQ